MTSYQGTAKVGRPATEKQIEFINRLAEQVGKPVPDHVDLTTWTTAEASEMIERLKALVPADAPGKRATERQVAFVQSLIAEREIPQDLVEVAAQTTWDVEQASALIRALKVAPRLEVGMAAPSHPEVLDGRYAIPNASGKGGLAFYKVWTRRDGSRGVDLQVSDDYLPVGRAQVPGILARIAEDVQGASAAYGREIGCCGVCGRTLTDETSRAVGIGPVCATRF